jgi:uncharacterized membrane protein YqjE
MPEPSSEDRRAAEAAGIWGHLTALLGAKLAYLRARLALAGIESREAAVHYGLLLGLALGGVVLVVFGYFFFVLAAVFAVAWMCGGGNAWIWVLLGAAVLHVVAAGGLFLAVKMRLARPVFTATLDEFRKDQAWLTTAARPN